MTADPARWQSAPLCLQPAPGCLYLWRFRTDQPGPRQGAPADCLDAAERQRAARLRDPARRRAFRHARAALRLVLAACLDCPAPAVALEYGPQGKPQCAASDRSEVQFNLSHSGCWGVIALRVGAAVGIDLEQVDAPRNIPQLVDFAFSAEEKLQWQAFPPERRRRGFYRLWTAREARLKCAGVGLTVATLPPEPALLRWFPVSRGYLAAVVSAAPAAALSRFHLDLAALG